MKVASIRKCNPTAGNPPDDCTAFVSPVDSTLLAYWRKLLDERRPFFKRPESSSSRFAMKCKANRDHLQAVMNCYQDLPRPQAPGRLLLLLRGMFAPGLRDAVDVRLLDLSAVLPHS